MQPLLTLLFILLVLVLFWNRDRFRRKRVLEPLPPAYRDILEKEVVYYQQLPAGEKQRFGRQVQAFLSRIKIEGVQVTVEDLDRVLVAASAVIPVFGFPGWEYLNLDTVLLYPGAFDDAYRQEGEDRNILGMVGSGALNRQMILSQPALRQGFRARHGTSNPGIHEFVHLLDKSDGAVDGIPENLLAHPYIVPWLDLMYRYIEAIKERHSDINPYAATNKAEFFAVVSEYFFERPALLKEKHPELYEMLERIFRQPIDYG